MKLKSIVFTSVIILFTSCVEEDTQILDVLSPGEILNEQLSTINFDRRLASIAIDESPTIELRDGTGKKIDSQSGNFNLVFTSDSPNLTISETGVINITNPNAIGESATIAVSFSLRNKNLELITPETITDEIIIGSVTISELEASSNPDLANLTTEQFDQIAINGYEPILRINELITEIDINSTEQLSLTLQGIKKEVISENVDLDSIIWASNDPNILIVNSEGILTPISEGTTIIRASTSFNGQTVVTSDKEISVSQETVVVIDTPKEPEAPQRIILGNGSLQSNSSYNVIGAFEIYSEGERNFISLSQDFSSGGAPDLVLYLSNNTESNAGASIVAATETQPVGLRTSGAQTFEIPSTINIASFQNVLLFCRRFRARVGFGIISK